MEATGKKRRLNNVMKVGTLVLGLLLIIFATSRHSKSHPINPPSQIDDLNEAAVKFTAFMVLDGLKSDASGRQTPISEDSRREFLEWAGIDRSATAREYEAAYDANEIAADNQYKDKRILVFGILAGIEKDITGRGYLDLAGSNPFLPGVQAELTQDSMGEAASMKKGQRLNFVCDGAGRVVTIALLNNCQPLSDYLAGVTPSVESKARDALNGKAAVSASAAQILAGTYAIGLSLAADSNCVHGNDEGCKADARSLSKDPTREQLVLNQMQMVAAKIKIAP